MSFFGCSQNDANKLYKTAHAHEKDLREFFDMKKLIHKLTRLIYY